jgi:hypothetical protein
MVYLKRSSEPSTTTTDILFFSCSTKYHIHRKTPVRASTLHVRKKEVSRVRPKAKQNMISSALAGYYQKRSMVMGEKRDMIMSHYYYCVV